MQERGYRLWEQDINHRGGILGRPVEVVIRDDKSNKEEANKIYQDLTLRERVDLVFGPYSSEIAAVEAHGPARLATGRSGWITGDDSLRRLAGSQAWLDISQYRESDVLLVSVGIEWGTNRSLVRQTLLGRAP